MTCFADSLASFCSKLNLELLWHKNDKGEDLNIRDHLVSGKVTVVDFFAIWCKPCREVDRAMIQLLPGAPDVAYRKVNIDTWSSAVSKRYLGKASELPYVLIFDKHGKQFSKIQGLDLVKLKADINKARTR